MHPDTVETVGATDFIRPDRNNGIDTGIDAMGMYVRKSAKHRLRDKHSRTPHYMSIAAARCSASMKASTSARVL